MRFNLEAEPEKFLRMARVVKPGAQSGQELIDWIISLSNTIGIPTSLKALGVSTETVDQLVSVAINDICHPLNPRPVTKNDFYTIYQDALAI